MLNTIDDPMILRQDAINVLTQEDIHVNDQWWIDESCKRLGLSDPSEIQQYLKEQEMGKKVVRTFFNVQGVVFFFDRNYDDRYTDQQNCDEALDFMIKLSNEKKIFPAMCVREIPQEGKSDRKIQQPALVNFSLIPVALITNVSVYEVEEAKEEQPSEEVNNLSD